MAKQKWVVAKPFRDAPQYGTGRHAVGNDVSHFDEARLEALEKRKLVKKSDGSDSNVAAAPKAGTTAGPDNNANNGGGTGGDEKPTNAQFALKENFKVNKASVEQANVFADKMKAHGFAGFSKPDLGITKMREELKAWFVLETPVNDSESDENA